MATIVTPGTFALPAVSDNGSRCVNVDFVVFAEASENAGDQSQAQVIAESVHPGGWAATLSADLTQITITMPVGTAPGLYSAHRTVPGSSTQSEGAFFRVQPVLTLTATPQIVGGKPSILLQGQ